MRIRTVSIDSDVEAVLRAARLVGSNLALQGQLDRKLYEKTNKVMELIGFKWDRKLKCHVGQGDSADRLRQALNAGACVDEKKTYQFYETPERLASRMVALAEVGPGDRVLEPSAGRGAIIDAIFGLGACERPSVVFAIELNPSNAQCLREADAERMENARHDGDPKQTIVMEDDFLAHQDKYDRIIMNPPFSDGGDIAHVRHAYDLLLPGGRLVAITSPSWKFNSSRKMVEFKEWYKSLQDNGMASIPEELPEGTFKGSGTGVKTLLLVALKPKAKNAA